MSTQSGKRAKLMDQMRRLIAESGLSGYRIAKDTGIDQGTISRFLSGQRGLSSEAIDRIGTLLELEIVMHRPCVSNGKQSALRRNKRG